MRRSVLVAFCVTVAAVVWRSPTFTLPVIGKGGSPFLGKNVCMIGPQLYMVTMVSLRT